jgi:hypothetical protein
MADDDAPQCKVVYTDREEPEETNWISRAGTAEVTYPNGCTFKGTFDSEKVKQGPGVYVWMGPGAEEEEVVEKARYEGEYKNGMRHGVGMFVYPNKDVYEGEFSENKMHGEGTYTYNSTAKGGNPDIYSGSFVDGKKSGQGRYEYGVDQSMFVGTWENGEMTTGAWELKGAAVYTGSFKLSRPFGEGKFDFASGLSQSGSYDVKALAEGEEAEAPEEGAPELPPNVTWNGANIVAF